MPPTDPDVFVPASLRGDSRDAMAGIIQSAGDAQARAALAGGAAWQNAAQGMTGAAIAGAEALQEKRAADKLTRQDAAFAALLNSGRDFEARDVMRIYGPVRGTAIYTGFKESQKADRKDPKVIAAGFDALSPELRAHAFDGFRHELAQAGVPEDVLPPTYSDAWWGALKPHLLPAPKPAPGVKLAPGETYLDPTTGKPTYTAPPKPDTTTETQRQRLELEQKRIDEMARHDRATEGGGAPAAQAREDRRLDQSYQFNASRLAAMRKPVADQAEKLSRLTATVGERTPAADALIAPELLTVMAGGQGSGLRMNEAEISRIIGGRSKFEGLKAALNQWSLDPSKALSVTDEQRGQIRALMAEVGQRYSSNLQAIDAAQQRLIDASSVTEQRQAMADLNRLTAASAIEGNAAAGAGTTVKAPNGKTYRFKTQAEADAFKRNAGIQ